MTALDELKQRIAAVIRANGVGEITGNALQEILHDMVDTIADNAGGSIYGATATVDPNVGTPSVVLSVVDGKLSFAFFNLKGEPGAKGDTVLIGQGQEYTLYNSPGNNTDGAMTQRATAELVSGQFIKVESEEIMNALIELGNYEEDVIYYTEEN